MTEKEAKEILGVVRGQSAEEVRRSYLRLLKKTRPETDPEGFQRLREAWELMENRQTHRTQSTSAPRQTDTVTLPLLNHDELLLKSRTGLSPEERSQLVTILETDREPPNQVLMAAINTVILEFDPQHPEVDGTLREKVSRTLSGISGADSDLLIKWSYAHQLFQAGPSLAPQAWTALTTILLYLDASQTIPEDSRHRLNGVADPSVAELYRLAQPTLAVYLDSRSDVRTLRSESLKNEFRQTVSVHLPKSKAWIGWVALLVVAGVIRVFWDSGPSPQDRLDQARSVIAARVQVAPLFPVPDFPSPEALEALSNDELAKLGLDLKTSIQAYQKLISRFQGQNPSQSSQGWSLARLKADQALLRAQLKKLETVRQGRVAPKP